MALEHAIALNALDASENSAIDFAIVTALVVERDAVLRQLDSYTTLQKERDALTYYRGHMALSDSKERYEIVVILLPGMGNNEAAIAATRLIEQWHPANILMVGIGAGLPGEVNLGDVVVGEFVYYYELAKLTTQGEQRRAQHFPADTLLLDRARALVGDAWPKINSVPRPDGHPIHTHPPRVRFGPIASGEKVVADETTLAALRRDCPKLLALAMEGAGVARAAASAYDRPRFLEIRGVSDYASPDKNDAWHGFAVGAAAAFVAGWLRSRPIAPRPITLVQRDGNRSSQTTPTAPSRHNLPSQLTPFIGRNTEAREVNRLLETARLVTLLGSGGVGKTRLALQVVGGLVDGPSASSGQGFADGVWLVELAALTDGALVPQTVASALGVPEEAKRSVTDTLCEALREKRLLIILDTCEHLIEACAKFAERLLRSCPHVKMLTTSREALRLGGEVIFRVPSLQAPDLSAVHDLTPERLMQYEAVQLFVDRAVAVQPGFALTTANAAATAQLCAHLDGIPLAIELAAARIKALPVEKIAARLDDRFKLLTGGSRTALPRQQTLRAMIDWSYELLSHLPETERAVLRRLSTFAGGCTLEAAEAICADAEIEPYEMLDALTALSDKSLVVLDERNDEARYRLLETIREYAAERLREANEEARLFTHHAQFFVSLAEQAEPMLKGAAQQTWLERLEEEHDNLRLAFGRLLIGDIASALRLAAVLGRFWDVRGYFSEGREKLARVLAAAEPTTSATRATALRWAGVLALRQGDYGEAQRFLDDSLRLSEALGDNRGLVESLAHQGNLAYLQGHLAQARALSGRGLELCKEINDKASTAFLLNVLGNVAYAEAEDARARELYEESLSLCRELVDKARIGKLLNNLGGIALMQDDLEAAYQFYGESLVIKREMKDRSGIAFSLSGLGMVALRQQDAGGALHSLQEGLSLAQELGDKYLIAFAFGGLGQVGLLQNNVGAAIHGYRESLMIRHAMGDQEGLVFCLEGFARVANLKAEFKTAAHLLAAVQVFRQTAGVGLAKSEQAIFDEALAEAHTHLSPTEYEMAWATGLALSLDDAIVLAHAISVA